MFKSRSCHAVTGETMTEAELIQAPAVIEISPYVTHKVEALCDFILLECNSIKDIQNDRIRDEV